MLTVPLPVPLLGDNEIQLRLSLAVHPQLFPDDPFNETEMVRVVAVDGNDVEGNDTTNEHPL